MYLLDTDHISLMDRKTAEGQRIRARLSSIPPDDVNASVVSFEEQVRGWVAAIALVNNVTVLSRNTAHFSRGPGLHIEDWSV